MLPLILELHIDLVPDLGRLVLGKVLAVSISSMLFGLEPGGGGGWRLIPEVTKAHIKCGSAVDIMLLLMRILSTVGPPSWTVEIFQSHRKSSSSVG